MNNLHNNFNMKNFFLGIFSVILIAFASNSSFGQTLTTDFYDYGPGTTVLLTGTGFSPNETVSMQVTHNPTGYDDATSASHYPWNITADGNGNISTTWLVPMDQDEVGSSLVGSAIGQTSNSYAEVFFTDGQITLVANNINYCDDGAGNFVNFTATATSTSCSNVAITYYLDITDPTSVITPNNYSFPIGVTYIDVQARTVGCARPNNGTALVTMTVTVAANPHITATISGPSEICQGTTHSYCVTASSGTAPYTYAWEGNNAGSASCYNYTPTAAGSHNLSVYVTDANSCRPDVTPTIQAVTIDQTPSVTVTDNCGSSQLCANLSGTWTGYGAGQCITVQDNSTYTFTSNNGCSVTASGSPKSYPSAPVLSVQNNCNGTSVVTSNTSVSWSSTNGGNSTGTQVTDNSADVWTATATSNGCQTTASATTSPRNTTSLTTPDVDFCGNADWISIETEIMASVQPSGGNVFVELCNGNCNHTNYTYTYTNSQGCSSTQTGNININAFPTVTASAVTACAGDLVDLNLSVSPVSGGTGSFDIGNPSTTSSGNYTYTFTANGCTNSASNVITRNSLPTCNITGTTTVTNGNSESWCGTAGMASYVWDGVSGSQCQDISTAGTHTLAVTNNGCTSTCSLDMTVIYCQNTHDNVSATACGSYDWSIDNHTYTYNASGDYDYTVITPDGCHHVTTLHLTVTPIPAQPTVACWQTATFNANTCSWDVTGTQPAAPTGLACYQTATFNGCSWDVTGTAPAAPTGLACYETATFNGCSWDVTGTAPAAPTGLACYQTATFNGCSWDVTGTAPAAPTGLACYETATFNGCSWDITGTAPAAPTGLACYQNATFNGCSWDVTGTAPAAPTGLACYQTATFNGCSWDVTGTQAAAPAVSVVNNCNGTSTFTATGSNIVWSDGHTGCTYTVNSSVTLTATQTVNGCASLVSNSVTSNPKTTPATPSVAVVNNCDGTSTLSTNASGSLSWNTNATTSSITVNNAGTYTVNTTVNGCTSGNGSATAAPRSTPTVGTSGSVAVCNGTSVSLSGTGASTYSWTGGITNGTSFTATTTGTYTVTGTASNGCTNTATATVTVYANPSVSLSGTNPSCSNSYSGSVTTTVTGGTTPYSYSWNNNATTANLSSITGGTYGVTVRDNHNCSATGSATIVTPVAATSTITGSTSVLGGVANTYNGPSGNASYSWTISGGAHVCDSKCHHNSAHTCGSGCDHNGHACTTDCHHNSGHHCTNNHIGDHHCSTICHHNSGHTCGVGCDHYRHSCTSACHHNNNHRCAHNHCGSPSIVGSASGSSVSVMSACCASNYTLVLTTTSSSGCTSSSSMNINSIATATITVYSSLYTTGSGQHPTTTKTALEANIKVFDQNVTGDRDGNQNHYSSMWNGTSGQVTNINISGPVSTSIGGGPADQYIITVPANDQYVVIGKSSVTSNQCNGGTCTIYTAQQIGGGDDGHGDDDDNGNIVACSNSTVLFHSVLKDATGHCTEGSTQQEHGSLMLIVSPVNLEFVDTVAMLPIIYESVIGTWDVSVNAEPPYGFYTSPQGSLSTSVTDNVMHTVQFAVVDTGSDWTFTKITHQIQHNGAARTAHSTPLMINNKGSKDYLVQNFPNPFSEATVIPYILPIACDVRLSVFDVFGREVAVLVNQTQDAGSYTPLWNPTGNSNYELPTGVYFAQLRASALSNGKTVLNSRRMVYIK